MKILLVEDEPNLRKLVKRYLVKNGYAVDEASDGRVALESLAVGEYDCLLLDLNLPYVDGIEIANKLRDDGSTLPIIMLTSRSQIYDKLKGFEIGTDDYITKPFDMKELLARIKAVIKRSSLNKEEKLTIGDYIIYPEKNVVMDSKKEIALSNKEMGVLEYLLRNEGRIVSAEELLNHVWGEDIDMFSDTVKTHIKTLRKKIDQKKEFIKTYRGKGYLIENI